MDNRVTKYANGIRNKSVDLIAPWREYHKKIVELFKNDPDITVDADDPDFVYEVIHEINIHVDDSEKAMALMMILPKEKEFGAGNITKINVIPKLLSGVTQSWIYEIAFRNNPALSSTMHVEDELITNPLDYIIFDKKVVQYFNDDIGNPAGIRSTLYQDIAKEVFDERPGVFYTTKAEVEVDD